LHLASIENQSLGASYDNNLCITHAGRNPKRFSAILSAAIEKERTDITPSKAGLFKLPAGCEWLKPHQVSTLLRASSPSVEAWKGPPDGGTPSL